MQEQQGLQEGSQHKYYACVMQCVCLCLGVWSVGGLSEPGSHTRVTVFGCQVWVRIGKLLLGSSCLGAQSLREQVMSHSVGASNWLRESHVLLVLAQMQEGKACSISNMQVVYRLSSCLRVCCLRWSKSQDTAFGNQRDVKGMRV
eukprot:scaffold247811_cov24-Tisochrysis_lutea.AAC.2